jgi:hypothetical protein
MHLVLVPLGAVNGLGMLAFLHTLLLALGSGPKPLNPTTLNHTVLVPLGAMHGLGYAGPFAHYSGFCVGVWA